MTSTVVMATGDVWTFNTGVPVNRGPIWSDGLDWHDGPTLATLAVVSRNAVVSRPAFGYLDPIPVDPSTVVGIAAAFQIVAASGSGTAWFEPSINFRDAAGTPSSTPFTDLLWEPRPVANTPGAPAEVTWVADDADFARMGLDLATVAQRLTQTLDPLTDGPRVLRLEVSPDTQSTNFVYEGRLLLYVEDGGGGAAVELPTRLFPRDDGVGLSAAPRRFPPPRARRRVGGYR